MTTESTSVKDPWKPSRNNQLKREVKMKNSADQFLEFRKLFPAYSQGVYMNHAAVSPLSTIVRDGLMDFWNKRSHIPVDVYPQIMEEMQQLKESIRCLVNAGSREDIAFIPNTSSGLSMVASALNWSPGDRVILNTMEFPANIYPFLNLERFGVEIDWIEPVGGKIQVEDIAPRITSRTRLLAISFVQFLNGFTADLEAMGQLCHDKGIWFVVDGIQGVGVIPLDVRKCRIDVLANGGHKWLMWPMGTGFLYIHPEIRSELHPPIAGWLSVKDSWNLFEYHLDFLESAEKFQPGTLNFMGLQIARHVLAKFLELGIDDIHSHLLHITGRLIKGFKDLKLKVITPEEPAFRSGIVSLEFQAPRVVMEHLEAGGVYTALREGIIRFSPHCTNTDEDVDRVLVCLDQLLDGKN